MPIIAKKKNDVESLLSVIILSISQSSIDNKFKNKRLRGLKKINKADVYF